MPDGYTCPLAPGVQAGDLPKGLLIVTLIEATNVPAMDWFSKSDVFVKCVWRIDTCTLRSGQTVGFGCAARLYMRA